MSCLIGLLGQLVTHHAMEEDKHDTDEPSFQLNLEEWLVDHQAMFNNATINHALSIVLCLVGLIGQLVTGHAAEDPKHVSEMS